MACVSRAGRAADPGLLRDHTVTSWTFEEAGVLTGLVYGPYHYTATLGPWLGSVPILIPLAWFMLVYPSYVVANLIGHGWPVGTLAAFGGVRTGAASVPAPADPLDLVPSVMRRPR